MRNKKHLFSSRNSPQFCISISESALKECTTLSQSLFEENRQFNEFGGVLIGFIEGLEMKIVKFFHDVEARASTVSINFSPNIHHRAKTWIKKHLVTPDKFRILGTWHVHPPAVSTGFSGTDFHHLFQERMLIVTEEPLAKYPRIHLIMVFIQNQVQIDAYTMKINTQYDLEKLQPEEVPLDSIIEKINSNELSGFYGVRKETPTEEVELFPYHPSIHSWADTPVETILGFWRFFPYPKVPLNFQKIFMENFFHNTQLKTFLYSQIYLDEKQEFQVKHYKVSRFPNENYTENIDYIKLEIRDSFPYTLQQHKRIPILLQEPFLNKSYKSQVFKQTLVSDLSKKLQDKLDLPISPVLFTYFTPKATKEISSRTKVLDGKVFLPDDLSVGQILNSVEVKDPLVIYFHQDCIAPDILYELRTDRFVRIGYDIEKLRSSTVLLGGGGLLGNEIAFNLAVLGLGNLTIIDFGSVDWYNLYRQQMFSKEDIFQPKAQIIAEKLNQMGLINVNAFVLEVPCRSTVLSLDDIKRNIFRLDKLVQASDIVIGAFDIASARITLQILAKYRGKPFCHSGLIPGKGEVIMYPGTGSGCYCCQWFNFQFIDGGACTLAPLEAQKIVGGLTSSMVYNQLVQKSTSTQLTYLNQRQEIIQQKPSVNPKCKICSRMDLQDLSLKEITELILDWLFPNRMNI